MKDISSGYSFAFKLMRVLQEFKSMVDYIKEKRTTFIASGLVLVASIIFLALCIFIIEIIRTFSRIRKFKRKSGMKQASNDLNVSQLVPTTSHLKEAGLDTYNVLKPASTCNNTNNPLVSESEEIENCANCSLMNSMHETPSRLQNDEAKKKILVCFHEKANLKGNRTQINVISDSGIQGHILREENCRLNSQNQNHSIDSIDYAEETYHEESTAFRSRNLSNNNNNCYNHESFPDDWSTFHFQYLNNNYPLDKNNTLYSRNFSISRSESAANETYYSDEISVNSTFDEKIRYTRKLGRRGDGFSYIVCNA